MGVLETNLYSGFTLWMLLGIALSIGFALFLYYRDSTTEDGKMYRKGGAAVAAIAIVFLLFGLAIPVTVTPPSHTSNMVVTIAETATASCYDFADYSTDGACDPATPTTDIVVNDGAKTVTLGMTVDWSANAAYALATTTAFDTFGVTFTVRRTDGGWTENGVVQKMAVSASISGITSWKIKSNVTPQNDINVVAQNAQGVSAIAWTDNAALTQVGSSDAGGLLLLDPSGGSGTIKLTVYFNEASLPRSFTFGTYSLTATITVSMQNGPTLSIPVNMSLQAQA